MSSGLNYTPPITQILSWFKYVCVNDTVIADWCMERFGKAPSFFAGVDAQNPPGEANAPLITCEWDIHKGGSKMPYEIYRIIVSCGLFNPEIIVDGNSAEVVGNTQIAEMLYLVRDRIDAALPNQIQVAECEIVNTNGYFLPMFFGQLEFFVHVPRCIGGSVTFPQPPA